MDDDTTTTSTAHDDGYNNTSLRNERERRGIKFGDSLLKGRMFKKIFHLDVKRKLNLDMHVRWNSTYKMLSTSLYFKDVLFRLRSSHASFQSYMPLVDEWDKVHGWCIAIFLEAEKGTCDYLKEMVKPMLEKFDKYWSDYNLYLSCATILDLRYKVKFVEYCFSKLYGSVEASRRINLVLGTMKSMFEDYKLQYASSSPIIVAPSPPSTYGARNYFDDYDHFVDLNSQLDILEFWHQSSVRYPVVSKMARDLLTIPVKTVTSEYDFSIGGKIVSASRSYAPEALIQAVQKLEKRVNKVDERSAKAEVGACDMTDSVGKVENEVITLKGQLGELDDRLEEVSLDAQSLADQAFEKMMGEMAKMCEEFTGELLALKKENELLKEELTSLKRTTMVGGATIQVGPKVEIPKPPKYHGKRDAREIDNFLWSIERYFEAVHLEEDASKINVVTMYLGDDAILWWRRREQDIKNGSCSIRTWDQFKEDFKKQFRPHDAAKVSMMKLRELKHSSTIKEYIKQFTTLVLEIDNLPEPAQLLYFIGGLERWAQQEVERRNVQTLAEAIAAAESLVDYRDTRKEGRSNGSKGKGGGAKPTDRSSTNSNKTVKKDKAKGSSSSSSSSDKPNNRGCYLCGGPHWARDCPGRQKLSAIIASGGESSGDDAQTGSLRLFSSVRATPKAEESTKVVQVSTLPRPKGSLMFVDTLVNGRASKALVDCGASHNFITEKEAMKLGIKYTKEPGRIKTVNTSPVPILGVAHKVPICLGQWSGTINLTVVHMDDFSLVLGLEFIDTVRPVSFEADGSIMIKRDQGSWSVPVTREEVEAKTISAIQVSRGIKKGQETFLAALVEEEEPHGNEVPSEIFGVLAEYKDVMPPELPKRLPPRREKELVTPPAPIIKLLKQPKSRLWVVRHPAMVPSVMPKARLPCNHGWTTTWLTGRISVMQILMQAAWGSFSPIVSAGGCYQRWQSVGAMNGGSRGCFLPRLTGCYGSNAHRLIPAVGASLLINLSRLYVH
uniref:Retrotransposon gag domain-containing protein n=1 Tax=Chenopodium quinoa TaxID=63459 RepID=A0A803LR51_CHEQI